MNNDSKRQNVEEYLGKTKAVDAGVVVSRKNGKDRALAPQIAVFNNQAS